jgi:thiol-disulfide isomerase/thioredoxin
MKNAFLVLRGGSATTEDETSLDDKVQAAMKKLGLSSPVEDDEGDCPDGVCALPSQNNDEEEDVDPNVLADQIAKDMNVDSRLVMAAIGATLTQGGSCNEDAARAMIKTELDQVARVREDSPQVQELVKEGFDLFLSRRALAFADNNMQDARAILLADQMDEEEEEEEEKIKTRLREEAKQKASAKPDMVEVKTDFDPTVLPAATSPKLQTQNQPPEGMPKPAQKQDVVFEIQEVKDIQQLVLESPVPILLDVYADWCGPCKMLTPALEEMAVKSGGVFRLVKVNTDLVKPVSQALQVTALPTVFGVRDGRIVHMFQGMPKSEDMMKNFMMGLFGAAPFQPAVTAEEKSRYEQLTMTLIKTAGAASFSFSAREKLTDRLQTQLDKLVSSNELDDLEGAAALLRTLFHNIVRHPFDSKFRSINLDNNTIQSKLQRNPTCLAILKSVGFRLSGEDTMIIGKGKKIANVTPLSVARDTIDNWIQKNQREMAAAARQRKDDLDRANLQLDEEEEAPEEEEEEELDSTICQLKLRLDGKNKVHQVALHEDDPLAKVLDVLNVDPAEENIQITCVAKKMVVSSSKEMEKTLKQHGLLPSAALVVKAGSSKISSGIKQRASSKKLKKGSHTMQSIGVYAKDDNNKAELIDGGNGVWYEHDVSDDEEEEESKEEISDEAKDDEQEEESKGEK